VKLWTLKFVFALAVLVAFVLLALPLDRNPATGEPAPLWDFTQTGVASFIFLIALLVVVAHVGSWVMHAIKREKPAEAEDKKKRRKKG
jgi:hypothetical protein